MATVLIAGGTGLVGQRLSQLLMSNGHKVRLLSRRANPSAQFVTYTWDIEKQWMQEAALDQVDYVINLAGAGIADQRWSASRKKLIIDSRVKAAAVFQKYLPNHPTVKAYLGASAIGYYGNRKDQMMDEQSDPGVGFLSKSTIAWEQATAEVAKTGIRTITLRIGIVLSTKGGALKKMLLPFKMGVGNYFGKGDQYYSWIHIDDLAGIIQHLLQAPSLNGIYNAVAPHPQTNKKFAETIKKMLYPRSVLLPAPSFGLRLALGEMAAVVLDSTRVSNKKISQAGFNYRYPNLDEALKDVQEKNI